MTDDIQNHMPDQLFDHRVPIGGVILFPGAIYKDNDNSNLIPSLRYGGWMESKGQMLDVKLHFRLFSVIGYIYNLGDEPQDTFRIPDMRGLFVRGVQNEKRTQTDRSIFDDPDAISSKRLNYSTLNPQSASAQELVGTFEEQDVIEHVHKVDKLLPYNPGTTPPVPASSVVSQQQGNSEIETLPFGGVETRPTNIAMYYLIKVFDSRWKIE